MNLINISHPSTSVSLNHIKYSVHYIPLCSILQLQNWIKFAFCPQSGVGQSDSTITDVNLHTRVQTHL